MNRPTTPGVVFIALGVVFIAVGSSGQRALLGVGFAFLVVGLVYVIRQRRAGEPK
jgi:membrane protein implicated in regulation of membrane protease activity